MDQSKSVPTGEAARNTNTAPTKNIVDTVIAAGHFTTFAAAINAAGLTAELAAKGPFTVFAPTDEAFKKLPAGAYDNLLKDAGKLKAILNYHVVSGYFDGQRPEVRRSGNGAGHPADGSRCPHRTCESTGLASPRRTSLRRTASCTPSTRSFCPRTGNCWRLQPDDCLSQSTCVRWKAPFAGPSLLVNPRSTSRRGVLRRALR